MKNFYIFLLVVLLLAQVGRADFTNMENEIKNLLKIDQKLSQSINRSGNVQALSEYLSEDGVVLPQNGHPIIGKKSFLAITSQSDLKSISTWKPFLVKMSNSRDLAYTLGRFLFPKKDSTEEKKDNYDYNCLIWRKNRQGEWKIVFCRGLFLGKISNKKPDDLNQNRKLSPEEKNLIKTELCFSKYSVDNGIAKAFYNFMDANGLALSSTGPPLRKETYKELILKKTREGWENRLEWKPIYTYVASSADLGYNFGPYEYSTTSPEGKTRAFYGYFLTVWKKQSDSSWKFVFDGGNQSPPPKTK